MAMSLKERMQRDVARREQKRVERAGAKTLMKGADIVSKLNKSPKLSESDLDVIGQAVSLYRNADDETREMFRSKLNKRDQVLHSIAEDEMRGEWMELFEKLVAAIPAGRRQRPFAIDFPGWCEIGAKVGMPEEQVVEALKVMLVFRAQKGLAIVQKSYMTK